MIDAPHPADSRAKPSALPVASIQTDIAVIGGGLAGMTLAIACASHGISTVLVEAEAMPTLTDQSYDGRSSAIAYGSQQVLAAIGAWPYLKDHAQPILDIRVTDGSGFQRDARRPGGISPFFVHYNHRDLPAAQSIGGHDQPPFGYIVENRASRVGLIDRLKQIPGVAHLAPALATSVDLGNDSATISLADGRQILARLVVAADGRRSALRGFAGIGSSEFDYHQSAIVCTVMHEHDHGGVAHEHFLPAGPFAMLPMVDAPDDTGAMRHRSSIVWTEDPRLVKMLLALNDDDFGTEIERRFGLSLGRVRPLGPRFAHPLKLLVAERYVGNRLVLVGDAAHGIHPIAGQGFNLGVRDVAALAEVLVDAARLGQDLGSPLVLERYARWR
ncbi:MAG TPA: UbiH/UbiF/VisC/COQ6 family ubiquinone biosynthesis hydroxylase, partial [Dongiaceae bacterium]